jgi:hypothetical protein
VSRNLHVKAQAAGRGLAQAIAEDVAARTQALLMPWLQRHNAEPDETDSQLVFVACSFTPQMDPVYHAIALAAQAVGLRAERVKDVPGDYRITGQILTMIRRARLVIADLTDERPNVYFELGYARGLGKTVITILRSGTTAHFDVRDWTYLEYFDSRPLEEDLIERLRYEICPVPPHPAVRRPIRCKKPAFSRPPANERNALAPPARGGERSSAPVSPPPESQ